MLKEMFLQSKASWIKYDKYEWRADKSGEIYLMPAKKAKPEYYDPIKCSDEIVLRALAIGKLCMLKNPDEEIQPLILQFAHDFGLFGIMTALPTTANFVDYTAVYLPQNNIIKQESMDVLEYLDLFFSV